MLNVLVAVSLLCAPLPLLASGGLGAVMAEVHRNHPALQAARNALDATYELYPRAVANFLPSISTFKGFNRQRVRQTINNPQAPQATILDPATDLPVIVIRPEMTIRRGEYDSIYDYGVQVQQNLFRMGGDTAQWREADYRVRQQRAVYDDTVQQVMLQAVQAYLEVRLARRTIGYREVNLTALQERLRITNEQFDIGDKTRADLEQVRARVAVARADLASAQAASNLADATFLRVVGRHPGALLQEAPLASGVVRDFDELLQAAHDAEPRLQVRRMTALAANQALRGAVADAGISVNLQGSWRKAYNSDHFTEFNPDSTNWNIGVRMSLPIYQGGRVGAAVRQARKIAAQRHGEHVDELRAARERVTRALENFLSSEVRLDALEEAVLAAETALGTVRLELGAGQRLVVDVLDASRDLVNNQVSLEQSRRDWLFASYQLRRETGRLTAQALNLPELAPERSRFGVENFAPTPYNLWRHRDVFGGAPELEQQ